MGMITLENKGAPIIRKISYDNQTIQEIDKVVNQKLEKKLLLEYPTVYIINDHDHVASKKYSVYVGETANIKQRSLEHLQINNIKNETILPNKNSDQFFWQKTGHSKTAQIYIIGHEHFNKSLTLDIENKLIHYMSCVDKVEHIYNRRENPQNEYYTSTELEPIFSKIWLKLRKENNELFPLEEIIRDSAIFKASPFHKLTPEQLAAKDKIIRKIESAISRNQERQLILVGGDAGAGKTVLLSSLFYELFQAAQENSDWPLLKGSTQCLLVNHEQQLKVYKQIATKLGLNLKNKDIVSKPTRFINNHDKKDPKVDVILVDEAHLLWTQGKQSYRGDNQLKDLLDRARVVVAVFDEHQILSREQYIDKLGIQQMIHDAIQDNNYIKLENQLRINANEKTIHWLKTLIYDQTIMPMPIDKKYDLKVFNTPGEMYAAIKQKATDESKGISRVLATFDWPYKADTKPANDAYWNVTIDDFKLPWNLQLPQTKDERKENKSLAWAEQKQTINEVGSTFTVQGFDLNYAGVIIGPSVKYRNGKIIFDKAASENKKATQQRTINEEKIDVSEALLNNELNVLLSRGVNGLYLYAVDEALQQKLLAAQAYYSKDNHL